MQARAIVYVTYQKEWTKPRYGTRQSKKVSRHSSFPLSFFLLCSPATFPRQCRVIPIRCAYPCSARPGTRRFQCSQSKSPQYIAEDLKETLEHVWPVSIYFTQTREPRVCKELGISCAKSVTTMKQAIFRYVNSFCEDCSHLLFQDWAVPSIRPLRLFGIGSTQTSFRVYCRSSAQAYSVTSAL
jgi:hypothetical protein